MIVDTIEVYHKNWAHPVVTKYAIAGKGIPELSIHGSGGDYTQWYSSQEYVGNKGGIQTISFNIIGHGGTADQVECNITNNVLLVEILFEKLKSMGHVDSRYKPHVVGHSFGGSVATYFALKNSVESLTLIDPAFTDFDYQIRAYAQDGPIGHVAREIIEPLMRRRKAREYFPGWSDDMIRPQLRIVGVASKKSRQESIRSLIESEEETKRIFKERELKTQKINLITGEKAIHRKEQDWLQNYGVSVYELKGKYSGHCPHLQMPEKFNEILYDLLTGNERSARLRLLQVAP